ncbi:MAG: hypothetical protein J6P13_01440 [Kiritimatiellae bacterium]|nr:hypothetical protein [Kiritimatiellia bacterium]
MIVFGADTITASDLVSGTIYICEGAVVTNRNASHWEPDGNMKVNGTFAVTSRAGWTDSKPLELGANGVVNFIGSGVNDNAYNFSNITGSGKILFSNGTGYSMLPSDASKMPSTEVAVVNDNTESYVVLTCTDTTTIGTLSGSGKFDSRYGNATTRRLAVVQGADSEWSGTFVNDDRVGGMDVSAKSGATAKTLTLSGTQTANNELVVQAATETTDAGSVNLTGTWVGATTVAGTFGGTGTLTGNLTFNAGSTFKAFASDENGLEVSGNVTFPTTDGAVDLSGITLSGSGTTLITTTGGTIKDISKLSVSGAVLALESDGTVLKAYPVASITIGGETTACASLDAAQTAALLSMPPYGSTPYDYITVYQSTTLASFQLDGLKIKKASGDVVVTITAPSAEFSVTQGDADENGIITCALANAPTTYTWTDAYNQTGAGDEVVPNHEWTAEGNWGYGSGVTANRYPVAGDTVVFNGGATVALAGDAACAALQVSGAVTFIGGGTLTSASAITLGANDSITITGTLLPTPTTTVADSYVKETGDTTKTYAVDAYNTVTITGATATRKDDLGDAIKDGDTITFTLDADEGYAVDTVTATSGEVTESDGVYSYTVTQDATITVTTVSTSLTIGAATVEYLADYSKAKTVSATVTTGTVLEGTEWTLKTNGVAVADATGTYANGTVTFSNISVTLGDSITYSIEASNGSTGTSAESAASTVGNVTGGWIVEDKDHSGSTGAWTTDLTYTDGVATITDANTYTPTKPGGGIVTLETVVKFGNEADPEVAVGDGAQGAVKIANGKFAVYGKTASDGTAVWQSTTVDANVDATYTVKLIINYNTGTFTVSVKTGADAATALGDTWYLATEATKVSSIAYKGTGAFTSLSGSFISGDVDVIVDETGVAVSGDFISKHLAGKTVAEAAAALAPDATGAGNVGANGLNYFTNYALGLNPEVEDDKPIVSVTTDAAGNYKVSVTDKNGNELKTPANVSVTPKFYKYTPNAVEPWGAEAQNATLSPGDIVGKDNVGYIRAKIEINAK